MTRAAAARTPPLFSNINVTPFIDVLLVLIIMLILTIPVGTHKLPIDIPQPGKTVAPAEPHVLAIDARGALYWDGRAVGDAQLPALLAATVAADVPLAMNTDPEARFDRFDHVLAAVRRAGVTQLGFVGRRPLED